MPGRDYILHNLDLDLDLDNILHKLDWSYILHTLDLDDILHKMEGDYFHWDLFSHKMLLSWDGVVLIKSCAKSLICVIYAHHASKHCAKDIQNVKCDQCQELSL